MTNDVLMNLQELIALAGILQFNSFMCLCEQPEALFAPGQTEPEFGMEFCDFDELLDSPPNPPNTPNPGYIGAVGDATCNIETLEELGLNTLGISDPDNPDSENRGISGNINSLYGAALSGDEWMGEGCDVGFWDVNRYSPDNYQWPQGTDPEDSYNEIFSTNFTIYRIVVTTEEDLTDEEVTLQRGRVSSDGVSIGTATFQRESTTSDTEDFVDVVSLNSISDPEEYNTNPTLAEVLLLPKTKGSIDKGSVNRMTSESVAALLNARNPGIDYFYTEQTVIVAVQMALIDDSFISATDQHFTVFNGMHEINLCPES